MLVKDETKKEQLESVMNHLTNVLRQCAILLSPVLLEAPNKLYSQLNIPEEFQSWETVNRFDVVGGQKVVEKSVPMFPRLDAAIEVEYIKNLMLNK